MGCCQNWDYKLQKIFYNLFHFFFLPAGAFFTITVTILSSVEGVKRLCYMFTGSYSFTGIVGPNAYLISTGEFFTGLGISVFLGLCFICYVWLHGLFLGARTLEKYKRLQEEEEEEQQYELGINEYEI